MESQLEKFNEIIDSYKSIANPTALYHGAEILDRMKLADPGKPTDDEWKKLLTWARQTQRAGFYHTAGIEAILEMIDTKTGSHGTEAIFGNVSPAHPRYWIDICAQYVNTGDTYTPTILYDSVAERFLFTSWGDFFESKEKKYKLA